MYAVRPSTVFNYQILKRNPQLFERLLGLTVEEMQLEIETLRPSWDRSMNRKKVSGRPYCLPDLENHVLALMLYFRARVTYQLIGSWFGVNETTAMRRIKFIEPLVTRSTKLHRDRRLTREDVQAIIDELSDNVVALEPKGRLGRPISALQTYGNMGMVRQVSGM
ncbi:helix-turn-helix domain-containing protein [Magnetococcus sp. PR-3]|uniref:helix-turn-helix domain-containing protein n=1 Tax=Magnetococcus sp. PR-3 TaxID=3120355 RepID=UPI002FCDFEE0